ncbi:MAG: DNA-processing protein DprA [Desulfobacteraceae bacterium]|jgi:DNA processing protein
MEHLVPWFTLKTVSGIGNLLFHRLLSHFGTPQKVLQTSSRSLQQVSGISPRLASVIAGHRTPDWVHREIETCTQKGFNIITQQDSRYPTLLLHIPDPPPILYSYGNLKASENHIAVVGSRKATTYGKTSARRLCRDLACRGLSVVSGMARGIDTAAHVGALDGGGRTIAVLGSGLNKVYPADSHSLKLFHRIAENGAVISEFPLNTEPEGRHFPQRNRIISGMSLGTVVVEAAKRSGSLITARLATEQGRDVFAVPGSIHAATARGTHDLIKQGALLIENAEDVIEEIAPQISVDEIPPEPITRRTSCSAVPPNFSDVEEKLLKTIGPYPVHIDELARRSEMNVGALTAALLQLELKGAIYQEPGKFFIRAKDG